MDVDHSAMSIETFIDDVPTSLEAAKLRPDYKYWKQAVDEEMAALEENNTWSLVERNEEMRLIDSKWVFSLKRDEHGEVNRYKVRLVARGFMQRQGFDYEETYAPVARLTTIRTLLSVINQKDLVVRQMDVKSAFLHGTITENLYMKKPEGLKGNNNLVCKLNKALYGLKQASYCWNKKFNEFMLKQNLIRSNNDPCLYIKCNESSEVYLLLYVDDIIIASSSVEEVECLKQKLMESFNMKDMGNLKQFLGINIRRTGDGIYLSQANYLKRVLERFRMQDCKGSKIPMDSGQNIDLNQLDVDASATVKPIRELIGCLMYVTLGTRPDLSTAVNFCSRHQNNPSEALWQALKRILRYVKETVNFELFFEKGHNEKLVGFADSDWAGDERDRKSTTGFLFKIFGATVCWSTKKQSTVATSSTEAEYVALFEASREGIWLLNLLSDFGYAKGCFTIYEDNQSCIKLANKWEHKRLKHVDVKFNFIRELVDRKDVSIVYISSSDQIADILTKNLKYDLFVKHRFNLGLRDVKL